MAHPAVSPQLVCAASSTSRHKRRLPPGARVQTATPSIQTGHGGKSMYVVLGASGNTGHVVATNLLAAGKKVRVVGRSATHLQPLAAAGAEVFVGDVTDVAALSKAFQQADSAYVMIPPNPTSNAIRGFQERVSDAISSAAKIAGVKNI